MDRSRGDLFERNDNVRGRHFTRRKTVSGPTPPSDLVTDSADHGHVNFMWTSPSAPTSPMSTTNPSPPIPKPNGRRRGLSGSILSKLSLLREGNDVTAGPLSRDKESPKSPKAFKSRKSIDDDPPITSPTSPSQMETAMNTMLQSAKTRRRKGSLRKTALLGGKRMTSEVKERRNSLLGRPASSKSTVHNTDTSSAAASISDVARGERVDDESSGLGLATDFEYGASRTGTSNDASWPGTTATAQAGQLGLLTKDDEVAPKPVYGQDTVGSPPGGKSPISQTSYASTTDDEEVLTFDRRSGAFPAGTILSLQKPLSSAATSYFPTQAEVSLPRTLATAKSQRSPLSHTISSSSLYAPSNAMEVGHDYTETEYWGWVILFVTWSTFTVGMGSCLELWSWAWDVGETPYAPPELEDDPTLPIVGYYPALIILTGVVAWIWITVAWVGMKYFRHAKIEV